jgi:hypothetical protein
MKEKVSFVNMLIDTFELSAFENGIFLVTIIATSAPLDFTLWWHIPVMLLNTNECCNQSTQHYIHLE